MNDAHETAGSDHSLPIPLACDAPVCGSHAVAVAVAPRRRPRPQAVGAESSSGNDQLTRLLPLPTAVGAALRRDGLRKRRLRSQALELL